MPLAIFSNPLLLNVTCKSRITAWFILFFLVAQERKLSPDHILYWSILDSMSMYSLFWVWIYLQSMAFGQVSPAELASACFMKVFLTKIDFCIHILQITKVGRIHNFTSCWSKEITNSLLPFVPFLQSCVVYSSILGSSWNSGRVYMWLVSFWKSASEWSKWTIVKQC